MALFDGYYEPQSYSGNSGGLIDRLLAGLQQQSAYQPTAAPQQPMNPIAVGNYQMPRIGDPSLYQPDQTALPANAQPTQGQMPQAQDQPLPPALGGNTLSGNLGAGWQTFANHGGIFPAITAAITGQRQDAQGIQQQNLQAQYQAFLRAGLSPEKAQLAVLNPEFAKTIIPATFGGDKFGFTTLPDGTVVRQNAHTGEVEPAYQGGTKPTFGIVGEEDGRKVYGWQDPTKRSITPYQPPGSSEDRGTVTGPDGKPIAIPPGVDRKTFVNEISKTNADAASGKMTEVQAKASSYAARMEAAEKTLSTLDKRGTDFWAHAFDNIPVVGGGAATNWTQSKDYQLYKQARDNFISGVLRQESGAAISPSEFTRTEKEYFPQPGDGKDVITQKAKARSIVIEQMKRAAGPGYRSPSTEQSTAADPLGIR